MEWVHHLHVHHPAATTEGGTPKESDDLVCCPLRKEKFELEEHSDDHIVCHLLELAVILPGGAEDSKSSKFHDPDSTSKAERDHLAASPAGLEPPRGLSAGSFTYSAPTSTNNPL